MAKDDGTGIYLLVVFGLAFAVPIGVWIYLKFFVPGLLKRQFHISTWVWLGLGLVFLAFVNFGPNRGRPIRPAPPWYQAEWFLFAVALGVLGCAIVALVGFAYYRQHDRDASRALTKARAGDVDGAIADLRAAMEDRKPSAIRSNILGLLHAQREEWPEAYKWFLDAEKVGGCQANYLVGQGVALFKMGRLDEAVAPLGEACSLAPQDVVAPCNYGLVLVDLGRLDEAREQLTRAEANYKALIMFPASAKEQVGAEVESLRKRLAADPKARDRALFDEV